MIRPPFAVKLGKEQREAAIKTGALGANTLFFKDGKFVMPSIGSDDEDRRIAELVAKDAGFITIMSHERLKHV